MRIVVLGPEGGLNCQGRKDGRFRFLWDVASGLIGVSDSASAQEVADGATSELTERRVFDNRITETRDRAVRISESRVLADRAEEVLENFVSFDGYFRAGYGKNDSGGTQVGFKAPGAFAKYRLGNEAETYGELGLTKNWFNPGLYSLRQSDEPDWDQAGPLATFVMMFSFFNPYEDTLSGSATDVALPQTWAGIANVIPSQPEATFWGVTATTGDTTSI